MRRSSQQGQGLSEYIILIALIAITCIGVIQIFGSALKFQMSKSITSFLGDEKNPVRKPRVTKKAAQQRSMRNFEESSR